MDSKQTCILPTENVFYQHTDKQFIFLKKHGDFLDKANLFGQDLLPGTKDYDDSGIFLG